MHYDYNMNMIRLIFRYFYGIYGFDEDKRKLIVNFIRVLSLKHKHYDII